MSWQSPGGLLFLREAEQMRTSMLPERFVFSEDLPDKTASVSGNNEAICFVCV